MAKKTTIYDIAKVLNVTAATVSRALNNNPRISPDTKKLVLETAAKMDYKPNRLALALKSGKSKNVGVVVPHINRNFFSTVIRGIEDELYPKGYQVIICQTHEDDDREYNIIQNLLNAQVDGILMSISQNSHRTDHFEKVMAKNVPLIFFDRKKDILGISSVTVDDYKGAYDATQHLIDQGCRAIGYLSVNLNLQLYQHRLEGYKNAVRDNGLLFRPEYVMELKNDVEGGKIASEKLMKLPNPPDAIFSSTDYGALGAIQYLKGIGVKIPNDFCVVGFSNEPFTQFMELSMSSVDQSPLEMGKIAARVLLEQIEGGDSVNIDKTVVLPPKLIIRRSSMKKMDNL